MVTTRTMLKMNQRQILFCDALLAGASQAEAYRRAGYKSKQPQRDAAELVVTPTVSDYLAKKRAEMDAKSTFTRERALAVLEQVANSGDTSSSRVAAVAQAAKMQGWNAPDKQELDVTGNLASVLAKVRGRS